ncbi:glycerophosphodiester phosphodiesterase family protein [Mucilaginibacter terrae]|uniref:glycerophosphodiester phosphodiesterase family protein n=1 Tax=Mucilaginibacter terrae TaxID=1955052 RepID=UPI003643D689
MKGTLCYLLLALGLMQATLENVTAQTVEVAAHRGDWRNAPENSVRAFVLAAELGVDIIELDLKATKDGKLIIMHDETIDRTTNGKGRPNDYTLEELKKLRLKNGLGRVTRYNTIPTLEEAMLALKQKKVKVNLDKSYPYFNEAYQVLKQTGTLGQAIFKSEAPFDSLKTKYPHLIGKITYMAVVNLDRPDARKVISNYIENMKPYAFELIFSKDTSSCLNDTRWITTSGARIWINSLWASLNGGHDDDLAVELGNTKDSWDWIIAHGASIIQTDRPKELLRYLKSRNKH